MSRRGFLKLGGAGLAGTALLGAAGCNAASSESSGETRTFTYAYEQPEETSHGIAATIFQEKLEEVSGGAMAIEQYPAGQLGGDPVPVDAQELVWRTRGHDGLAQQLTAPHQTGDHCRGGVGPGPAVVRDVRGGVGVVAAGLEPQPVEEVL